VRLLTFEPLEKLTLVDSFSQYSKGFTVSCALLFLGVLLSIILSISYRLENARRDRLYGVPKQGVKVDTRELADKVRLLGLYTSAYTDWTSSL